jgi:putative DNA primase/helicase
MNWGATMTEPTFETAASPEQWEKTNSPGLENASFANFANPGERVTVSIDGSDLHQKTLSTIAALQAAGAPVYQRGGELVRVRDNIGQSAALEILNTNTLQNTVAEKLQFVKTDKEGTGTKEVHPPHSILINVLSCAQWPFGEIEGVHQSPTMDAAGNIVAERGYSADMKLYIDTRAKADIPNRPTPDQVTAAAALIKDLLSDFCFERDADEANAIALLVTAVLRPMISGNVPAFCINAAMQGSGKTLLGKTIIAAATGREPFAMTYADDETENSKRLDAAVLEGRPVIFLDNVKARVTNTALAALLTSPDYSMRILGESKTACVHSTSLVLLTGNNPQFDADNGRRIASIRLDPNLEHPELSTGKSGGKWQHPDPIGYAIGNHGKIVSAVLTLARYWHTAGRPAGDKTLGSFDGWARTIGGILSAAGVTDFLGNLDDFLQGSADETLCAFVTAWHERHGEAPKDAKELSEAAGDCGIAKAGPFLKKHTGRVVSGYKITLERTRPTRRWMLVPISKISILCKKVAGENRFMQSEPSSTEPRYETVSGVTMQVFDEPDAGTGAIPIQDDLF